jgi:hypothetical protein
MNYVLDIDDKQLMTYKHHMHFYMVKNYYKEIFHLGKLMGQMHVERKNYLDRNKMKMFLVSNVLVYID